MDCFMAQSYLRWRTPCLLLVLVFSVMVCEGQLSIELIASTSTCANNGAVTVQVSNSSTPLTYMISSPNGFNNQTTSVQDFFQWTSLFPGIYTVTVSDAAGTISSSIEVNGDYVQPNLEISTIQEISCPGGSDGILSAIGQGGRPEYRFDLYKGTISTSLELVATNEVNGIFEGLASGTYTIFIIDSCANQVGKSWFLDENYNTLLLKVSDPVKHTCDDVIFDVEAGTFGGKQPYSYRILEPPELATSFSNSGIYEFGFIPSERILFEVIDDCGNSRTDFAKVVEPGIIAGADNLTCAGFDLSFSGIGMTEVVGYTVIDGMDTIYIGEEPIVLDVNYNTLYQVFASGVCGEEVQTVFLRDTFSEILSAIINPDNCQLGGSSVSLLMNQLPIPDIEFQLLDFPAAYAGDTIFNRNSSQRVYGLFSANGNQFIEGTYRVGVVDGCGRRDTLAFDIDGSQVLQVDLSTLITPLCGDLSRITYQLSDNFQGAAPKTISLYHEGANALIDGPLSSDSASFENLPVGDYYLEYTRCNDFSNREDIRLDTTPYPIIDAAKILPCEDNDSLTILVDGYSGIKEYEYRLLSGPENGLSYPLSWQNDPFLGKYPNGASYKVQLRDACQTIVSYDVSEQLDLEPEVIVDSSKCGFDTIIFQIKDPIQNIEYIWTLPNDSIAIGPLIEYPSMETAGNMQVGINIPDCTSTNASYDWNGECNIRLPVEWLYFDATWISDEIKLEWGTTVEINNSHFEILKSTDGMSYSTIAVVDGMGNTLEVSNYEFIDRNVVAATNYYKLKQVDHNGVYEYSEIRVIDNKLYSDLKIFPNPALGYFEIQFSENGGNQKYLSIYSIAGDKVLRSEVNSSENYFRIDCQTWPRGMYVLHLNNGQRSSFARLMLR